MSFKCLLLHLHHSSNHLWQTTNSTTMFGISWVFIFVNVSFCLFINENNKNIAMKYELFSRYNIVIQTDEYTASATSDNTCKYVVCHFHFYWIHAFLFLPLVTLLASKNSPSQPFRCVYFQKIVFPWGILLGIYR